MINIDKDITKAFTLPGSFYKSPTYFEQSKDSIFVKSWQFITETDQINIPSTVYPFKYLEGFVDEPLLFARDKDDQLHCMSNVCTHRGNILVESAGPIQGGLRCGYHGRRFELNGCFKSMPECEGMQDFPSKDDDLPQVAFKQWGKFLFASLSPAFPFEELVKEMDERVGWMPFNEFKFDPNRSQDYLVRANWALYCDNYLEGFHIPFIHKDLAAALDYSSYASEIYRYSNLQLGIAKGGDVVFDLPESSPDYGKKVAAYYYWLFPNMMFNFYPWGLSVNIVRPLAPDLTKVSFRSYIWDPTKIDQGAGALLDRVEREDEAVVEKVQRGTGSYLYKKGRFSPRMEKGVHHFHQLISDFMQA